MKNLDDMLKEIEARADVATEGLEPLPYKDFPFFVIEFNEEYKPTEKSEYISAYARLGHYARTDVPKLLAMLRLAIAQRDYWAQYAGEYLREKHIHRDDAELLAVGRGE